jgi:hypothetical protein
VLLGFFRNAISGKKNEHKNENAAVQGSPLESGATATFHVGSSSNELQDYLDINETPASTLGLAEPDVFGFPSTSGQEEAIEFGFGKLIEAADLDEQPVGGVGRRRSSVADATPEQQLKSAQMSRERLFAYDKTAPAPTSFGIEPPVKSNKGPR